MQREADETNIHTDTPNTVDTTFTLMGTHTAETLQLQRDGDSGRKMEPEVTKLSKVRQTENFISKHVVWIFKLCTFIYASYRMCIGLENRTGVMRRKESWK